MTKIKNKDLIERISKRTGLKHDWEINAYVNFMESADLEDGLIMFGNCKHLFWEEAQEWIINKKYGKKTYERYIGPGVPSSKIEEIEEFVNPLASEISEKEYNHYLKLFIKKGLVSKPRFCRKNTETKYPVLSSYNFFNDPEVYVPYRKKGEKLWNGRFPKNSLTKEEFQDWKSKGYEFKI
ncbi:MAG: hypothetical protein NUV46_03300 [Nanoarchaeota archaeon]|nr:hypothetical protein [Nanoarchaeota archaeon]